MSQINLQNRSTRLITLNGKINKSKVKYKLLPAGPAVPVAAEVANLRYTKQLLKDGDIVQLGAPSGDDLDLGDDDSTGSEDGDLTAEEKTKALQAEYKELSGKTAPKNWSLEKLEEEVNKAFND